MKNSEQMAREVYLLACDYIREYHTFPPYRWLIDNHEEITSTSMIKFYLDKLKEQGYMKQKHDGHAYRWIVKGAKWLPPAETLNEIVSELRKAKA